MGKELESLLHKQMVRSVDNDTQVLAVGRVWERRFNQTDVCNRTDLSKCTVLQDDASCDKQFHISDQKSQK